MSTHAKPMPTVFGSKSSMVVESCQICGGRDLESVLFLGFLPPVNTMQPLGSAATEQPSYPAELLQCQKCSLVQLGLIVDASILFPPEYAYTSSTTRILRDNFKQLSEEVHEYMKLSQEDLVVDIGSNDGNLLSNFVEKHRVQGVTPENNGQIAIDRGIPTLISYFNDEAAESILKDQGQAQLITATNVFAHIEDLPTVMKNILRLLKDDGVFLSESHYLLPLVETNQYDTVYHEHLRYYSLKSLKYLFEQFDLEIFHAKKIPTHGGSVRVYAARKGKYVVQPSVEKLIQEEELKLNKESLKEFNHQVTESKLELMAMLCELKKNGNRIYAIGAPSRAATLVNYVGLDDGIIDCILEIKGSHKIDHYMPGTKIPIYEESKLFEDQPEYTLFLSWHIADEIAGKLREKGYRGKFLSPLPTPRLL